MTPREWAKQTLKALGSAANINSIVGGEPEAQTERLLEVLLEAQKTCPRTFERPKMDGPADALVERLAPGKMFERADIRDAEFISPYSEEAKERPE